MIGKKKEYKALMLDLDGTTIPNKRDGRPSKKVIEAVTKAQRKLHVGVVTGRPFPYAKQIVRELGLTGPSIMASGAEIIDVETGKLLWSRKISAQATKAVLDLFEKRALKLSIYDSDRYKNQEEFDPRNPPNVPFVISVQDLPLSLSDNIFADLNHLTDIAVQKIVGWKPDTVWLSITHIEATKQLGIFEIAKILEIETHEIIGVGEGYNDFPLLMACGLRVAMGNAVEELKEIADYIAPSVMDDGVVDVINKFVLR